MRKLLWLSTATATVIVTGIAVLAADDPTARLLTASSTDGTVLLRLLDEAGQKLAKVPFEFRSTANGTFRPLTTTRVFTASDTVRIEFDAPNPFDVQISVSETQAEDPNNAQLVKFVDKLLTFPTVVGAVQSATPTECAELKDLYASVRRIRTALSAGSDSASVFAAWRKAIEDAPGRPGIVKAKTDVEKQAKFLRQSKAQVVDELRFIEAMIEGTSTPTATATAASPANDTAQKSDTGGVPSTSGTGTPLTPPPSPAKNNAADKKTAPRSPAKNNAADKKTAPRSPAKNNAADKKTTPPPTASSACGSPADLARALATIIDIGSVREGVKDLDALIEAVDGIAKSLDPYLSKSRWTGTNYLVYEVTPAFDQIKTVNVTAAQITYAISADGDIARTVGDSSSASLVFRHQSSLTPEIAAGMIVSKVLTPTYGTTVVNGQTVVAPATHKTASFSGALVLNAVCRCRIDHSFLYPMLQLGVATDGASPALLFGGGVRFTRPKRLALSAGVILAWIKDLNTLSVNAPVKGTADITSDLTFRNAVKPYFGFLYSF